MSRDEYRGSPNCNTEQFRSNYNMQQRPIGGHTASQEFRRFRKPYEKLRHYIVIIHVRDFLFLNMTELLHMCQLIFNICYH